jgi:hypothetical protein
VSWSKHTTLQCDECKEEFHDSLWDVVSEARAEAAKQGWGFKEGRDIGPECIKARGDARRQP